MPSQTNNRNLDEGAVKLSAGYQIGAVGDNGKTIVATIAQSDSYVVYITDDGKPCFETHCSIMNSKKTELGINVLKQNPPAVAVYASEKRKGENEKQFQSDSVNWENKLKLLESKKLELSYAGHLGKLIEPGIRPLGFDWKIGISLITSLAAREVFVGTMATIYGAGDADNVQPIRERMRDERDPVTHLPVYTLATGISLMLFYAFAMQCMSTVAVVRRETKSWKWPIIQFTYMGVLAYLASLIAYQILK